LACDDDEDDDARITVVFLFAFVARVSRTAPSRSDRDPRCDIEVADVIANVLALAREPRTARAPLTDATADATFSIIAIAGSDHVETGWGSGAPARVAHF